VALAMTSPSSCKCLHCREFFLPCPNNRRTQRYCSKVECRKASKADAQARWQNKRCNSTSSGLICSLDTRHSYQTIASGSAAARANPKKAHANVDNVKNYEETLIPTTDEEERTLLHIIDYNHDRPSFLRNHDEVALSLQKEWMHWPEHAYEVAAAWQNGATTFEGEDLQEVANRRREDLIKFTKLYQEAYEAENERGILGPVKTGFGFTVGDLLNWLSSLPGRTWTSLLFGAFAGIVTVILVSIFP
jgi:hypothetical protein